MIFTFSESSAIHCLGGMVTKYIPKYVSSSFIVIYLHLEFTLVNFCFLVRIAREDFYQMNTDKVCTHKIDIKVLYTYRYTYMFTHTVILTISFILNPSVNTFPCLFCRQFKINSLQLGLEQSLGTS